MANALYVLLFIPIIRQYLWFEKNNVIAWSATLVISISIYFIKGLILANSDQLIKSKISPFLFIVVIPLTILFLIKAFIPDISYDVLNYHIFNQIAASSGFPYDNGSYYPITPSNPTGDILANIFRVILGYRMGTIVNFIMILWSAKIIYDFLSMKRTNYYYVALGTLYIISSVNVLFEINNYMIDVYALPALLDATFMIVNLKSNKGFQYYLTIGFLLGFSIAVKLTNLAFVIPILLYGFYKLISESPDKWSKVLYYSVIVILAILIPNLPYSLYMFIKTANPIFPYYNTIFHSLFYPILNFKDLRWGPKGFIESIFWPFLMAFHINRTSELPYSTYRIPIAIFIIGLYLLYFLKKHPRKYYDNVIFLILVFILSSELWSFTTGYTRYGIYISVLAGVIIVLLIRSIEALAYGPVFYIKLFLITVCSLQLVYAFYYAYEFEWSMRPTIFSNPSAYINQFKYAFNDHHLRPFIPKAQKNIFRNIGAWVVTDAKTSGIEALLNPEEPIINPFWYRVTSNSKSDYLLSLLRIHSGKYFYSLCYEQDLGNVINGLDTSNTYLKIIKITPLDIRFFGGDTMLNMDVIKMVEVNQPNYPDLSYQITQSNDPLKLAAYRAKIRSVICPQNMKNNTTYTIFINVRNISHFIWPSDPNYKNNFQVRLGNHWLSASGKMLIHDDGRAALPYNLLPGMGVTLPLTIHTPNRPGDYILELDMVQEGVMWFSSARSKVLRINEHIS